MSKKWIYWFEELGIQQNDLVGKKCATLGEMTRLGMKVPPGFAISIDGYERFMSESGAGEEIRRYVKANEGLLTNVERQIEASRTIRDFIESKQMPIQMQEELYDFYNDLCARTGMPDVAVAVRSSGSVSMPGQMETYLNVKGRQSVAQRVVQVWGSAFTTRAIAFRLEKDMEMEKAPIGVAVLKMVNAKCAVVVLTVIPTTGDTSKTVVEGNWGLGESVVSGEITPDQFIVDKRCGDFECVIGSKTKMVCFERDGIRRSEVPKNLQSTPCLNQEELKEILRLSTKVEAHFQVPQDMEWVINQDLPFPDNMFWVQARPAKYTMKKENDAEYLAELMTRIFKM